LDWDGDQLSSAHPPDQIIHVPDQLLPSNEDTPQVTAR
jgi:hypothetical protein